MTTKVIFRKFKDRGDVIAIFPEIAGTNNPYRDCLCYQHIGQHGSCSLEYPTITRPLTHRHEYEDLYNELVSIGYDDLEVVTRISRKMSQKRIAQTI